MFGDEASKITENVPIYSFDGRDILRDSAWWVPPAVTLYMDVDSQLLTELSVFVAQARENGLAWIEQERPSANRPVLWNMANGRPSCDWSGIIT